jgi:hypothetical protein
MWRGLRCMWRGARAWGEGARGEGCAACEGPREGVARAALHARGARAMTRAWGEGARVAGAREGWRGLQGRGARAHAWQAALHARGRARGWRGLRFMRGGRGQWRGRGARMHARKEHTHLQKEAGCWRLDEGSDGDASALDRRCDSLLVCVMCRAHNESRAPPTSCTREGEHEGTRAARRALQARDELRASTLRESRLPRKARSERAGCLGLAAKEQAASETLHFCANVSFGDKFWVAPSSTLCTTSFTHAHFVKRNTAFWQI